MENIACQSRKNSPACISSRQASLSRSVSDPLHGYTQKPSASSKSGVVLHQDDAEQMISTLPIPIPKRDRDDSSAGLPLTARPPNLGSAFARLRSRSLDRLYLLTRFLKEQRQSSQDVVRMTTEALAKGFEDNEIASPKNSQNRSGSSLETDLLMIGGFAADFNDRPQNMEDLESQLAQVRMSYQAAFPPRKTELDNTRYHSNSF